jgi:ABC-2 type transport system ATP-binding protein
MADAWPQALEMLDLFGLADVLDRETHGFSHGMSRRLSVMLAAVTSSRVLILDEPFDGVDPLGVHATEHVIQQAREAGVAVIVSTHLLPLLAGVSDRIAVMVRGKVKETGPAGGYLGLTGAAHYEEILNGTADEDAPVPAGRP